MNRLPKKISTISGLMKDLETAKPLVNYDFDELTAEPAAHYTAEPPQSLHDKMKIVFDTNKGQIITGLSAAVCACAIDAETVTAIIRDYARLLIGDFVPTAEPERMHDALQNITEVGAELLDVNRIAARYVFPMYADCLEYLRISGALKPEDGADNIPPEEWRKRCADVYGGGDAVEAIRSLVPVCWYAEFWNRTHAEQVQTVEDDEVVRTFFEKIVFTSYIALCAKVTRVSYYELIETGGTMPPQPLNAAEIEKGVEYVKKNYVLTRQNSAPTLVKTESEDPHAPLFIYFPELIDNFKQYGRIRRTKNFERLSETMQRNLLETTEPDDRSLAAALFGLNVVYDEVDEKRRNGDKWIKFNKFDFAKFCGFEDGGNDTIQNELIYCLAALSRRYVSIIEPVEEYEPMQVPKYLLSKKAKEAKPKKIKKRMCGGLKWCQLFAMNFDELGNIEILFLLKKNAQPLSISVEAFNTIKANRENHGRKNLPKTRFYNQLLQKEHVSVEVFLSHLYSYDEKRNLAKTDEERRKVERSIKVTNGRNLKNVCAWFDEAQRSGIVKTWRLNEAQTAFSWELCSGVIEYRPRLFPRKNRPEIPELGEGTKEP